MKKLFVLIVVFVFLAAAAIPVWAAQTFILIHHESQGNGDPSWTKCMPDDAWNGHKNHEGDWKGGPCNPDPDPTQPAPNVNGILK